jgi:hypothetical protein
MRDGYKWRATCDTEQWSRCANRLSFLTGSCSGVAGATAGAEITRDGQGDWWPGVRRLSDRSALLTPNLLKFTHECMLNEAA